MSKILIVEDNAESRYMLERLLTSKGHRIITTENGEDALRLARQNPPEVIISDIMMPVMNGFRLCREVKRDASLRNIPFIFYTATFVEKADEKLAMSLGASRFVVKPTEGERFIQILNGVLDEHRQGTLPVPEGTLEGENILLEMYDNSVARKLAETVEKLQDERKALIKSKQRLKEAQELAHMGHWELDFKSNSLDCSDEIYRILGLKPKEFDASYEAFMAFVHPDDRAYVTRAHEESLAKKTQCDIECRVLLKDGTIKYVNERFQTIFSDNGTPNCLIGTVQDITERKHAEEALRKTESMYRLHFEHVSDVIFSVDHEFKLSNISPSVERLLDYKPEELIGRPIQELDVLTPEYLEQAASDILRVLRGEVVPSAEYQFITRDGTKKWVEISGAPLLRNGDAAAMIAVARDITERKRTEEALRQSEYQLSIRNRINEIFLTIPDEEMYGEVLNVVLEIMESKYGIFGYIDEDGAWVCPSMTRDVWDECRIPDKKIIFAKDQWGGIWGRAMNEKKALNSNKLLTVPEGHIPINRALDVPIIYQGALIGNLLVGNKETDYGEKDIQALESIADKIAPVLHSTLQIEKQGREKKQLEAKLAQSQKMEAIGTLAGGVAHDFNNLLTTIIGNADLALMDLGKDHPLRGSIEDIRNAGNSAASLTRQLLAFSRKQVIKPEVLDLNGVITSTEKMLKRLIGEDVELSTVLEPEPWKVHADRGQVEQVIMNLTVNARDAMPQGGQLTVETANIDLDEKYFTDHGIVEKHPGSYVKLSVSDTGIGMDKETQSHIFEPFFTSKGIGKGTGLGLSTVYGIIKQNNGFIWVYSAPGQGSTFKIYLPRVKGDVKAEKKERTPAIKLDGSETVLIVEDDGSLRKLAQKSLQPHGYRVLEAENGEDALRISKEHEGPIDLLITDVVMPKMGGKEIAERLQLLNPRMKVIYMSGYTDRTIVNHGVLAPGLNFLEKPFSPEGLMRKVREVLDKKQD